MSEYVFQQLINAITLGSLYALVAIGFSLIYGVIRLVNFAHGEFLMLGAFATLGLSAMGGLPWYMAFFLVMLLGFVIGIFLEFTVMRQIENAPMITGFVVTLSVAVIIQNLGLMFFGAQPRSLHLPSFFNTKVPIYGTSVQLIDLVIPAVTFCLAILVIWSTQKSRIGMAMRAVSQNMFAARLMGIPAHRAAAFAFGIGGSLAFVAGYFWGGKFGQIDPMMGQIPGLKAFVATIIGGVGSIGGAILGGYILAVAEIAFVAFSPPEWAGLRDSFVFGTLILILIIRPNGLLGSNEDERA